MLLVEVLTLLHFLSLFESILFSRRKTFAVSSASGGLIRLVSFCIASFSHVLELPSGCPVRSPAVQACSPGAGGCPVAGVRGRLCHLGLCECTRCCSHTAKLPEDAFLRRYPCRYAVRDCIRICRHHVQVGFRPAILDWYVYPSKIN